MASRYRALLIGNSTYPADEHNLQALKGPVKDIAELNRALADSATGLFADVDVTLLPEVASARAIRVMGRFFGEASRDDVLLFYFSGHGKLDQGGRLHLCMQDTESTDLLATAVSSARINEFADESRARNVVIVLDCCFSGAFRGADLGDAVAGPGRYVLTSCRGTQLANDATAENSTSYFTQHLVDGLLGAAADHDGDGYVTFSELYAYVDRRLREAGKQIPQRRVSGDGDLRLARRGQPGLAQARPPAQDGPAHDDPAQDGDPHDETAHDGRADTGPARSPGRRVAARGGTPQRAGADNDAPVAPPARKQRSSRSRRLPLAAAVATAAAAGGAIVAVLATHGGNPFSTSRYTNPTAFTYTSPFQISVDASAADHGCSVWLIDAKSGTLVRQVNEDVVYSNALFQISDTGTFKWQANDHNCQVIPQPQKAFVLPVTTDDGNGTPGDTLVFVAPAKVDVQITNWHESGSCDLRLYDAVSGTERDSKDVNNPHTPHTPAVILDPSGSKTAYLWDDGCAVKVTPAP